MDLLETETISCRRREEEPDMKSHVHVAHTLISFLQVTPVWRAGPYGPKTLCNACGVRYMKQVKKK